MFSIVIPTMQKNLNILNMLINQLVNNILVGEIIIIDNSLKGLDYRSNKIHVIVPSENLYVNPSWNLGVKTAKYEYIGIINDDLLFPKNYFEQVFDFMKKNTEVDFIGSDTVPISSIEEFSDYPKNSKLKFKKIKKRCSCWGIAIFFKKEKYIEIPNELKIWFGDDFLFDKTKNNYKISNSNIVHIHSLTSDRPEFRIYKEKDLDTYKEINPNYVEVRDVKFLERLFSVKNEYEYKRTYKRKVIYFLGFKIKLKLKKIIS